jgi:hypothetical protein
MAHLHPSMQLTERWASTRVAKTPRALSTDINSSRTTTTTSTSARQQEQQQAKSELLSWITGTKRGSNTTKLLRGQIEEAQVMMGRGCDAQPPFQTLIMRDKAACPWHVAVCSNVEIVNHQRKHDSTTCTPVRSSSALPRLGPAINTRRQFSPASTSAAGFNFTALC